MHANNNDRLAALRGTSSAAARLPNRSKQQPQRPPQDAAIKEARLRAERAARLEEERAQSAAVNKSFAEAQAKRSPIIAEFHCCICVTTFQRDVTDNPDGGRPSPLGDTCDACRAAGKKRPFELSGMTLSEFCSPICRSCKGHHWTHSCPGATAAAGGSSTTVATEPVPVDKVGHAIL